MGALKKHLIVGLLLISTVMVPSTLTLAEDEVEGLDMLSELYTVYILDAYAVTEVERVLYNRGSEALYHTFVFTIPPGALISNFSIRVEGVTYYADVLEKEEADEKYQQAVSDGKNAGMVASRGNDLFAYSVSIKPLEEMTAKIRYEQVLLKENGWHTYFLPIASDGDNLRVGAFGVDITIDSPTPIDELKSTGYDDIIETVIRSPLEGWVRAQAAESVPDEDIEVMWRTSGGNPEGKMYYGIRGDSGYFLHVFDPDPVNFDGRRVPKEFIFVLDKSGSMGGTKFIQATDALDYIYASLSKDDRFSFVEFNGGSTVYSTDLKTATSANVDAILRHIDLLNEGGSTNIHAGVCDALDVFKTADDTVPIIVLLTDGKANTGLYERSTFRSDVLEKNTVGASIYSIALGNGADWTFCEALALENNGRAIWVTEDQDVVQSIREFVGSFSSPLLAQLFFDYGPDVWDVHPEEVPAHFEGSEVLITGRFPLITTEIPMSLRAISPGGNLVTDATFPVELVQGQDFVPRFWAFQRIRDLENRMKYNGSNDDVIEEITQLATEFHFATDYTSLFVELPEGMSHTYLPERGSNYENGIRDSSLSLSNSAGYDSISNRGPTDPSLGFSGPSSSDAETVSGDTWADASGSMGPIIGVVLMIMAIPIILVVYVVISHLRKSPPKDG